LFKEAIDQYIQDKRQVFQVWHNLCSELTSMRTFKMYSRNTKTTNEPTASNNKSERPQVNIWDNWKTLKYFKEYLKLLNRLYDITWFGLVYAQ
jgi:hypothetical protein